MPPLAQSATERLKAPPRRACKLPRFQTGEFRDVEECSEDRLDRNRPHGLAHGGTPAQGRPRRDASGIGLARRPSHSLPRAARSSTSSLTLRHATSCFRSCPRARIWNRCYFGKDGVLSGNGKIPRRLRRLLDHLGRGIRRHPQAAESARRRLHVAAPVSGNAKVIKAGTTVVGRFRSGGGVQDRSFR